MNTPNKLTVFRMLLTPVFLLVFLSSIPHSSFWGALIFAIASVTDAIDGRLARSRNLITVFGKLADPVADKMLTTAALLAFMQKGLCSIWIIVIILTREFAVTSVRLVASAEGVIIPANIWGKLKTASQMIFMLIIMLMCGFAEAGLWQGSAHLALISNILMSITAALALVSGMIYILKSRDYVDYTK